MASHKESDKISLLLKAQMCKQLAENKMQEFIWMIKRKTNEVENLSSRNKQLTDKCDSKDRDLKQLQDKVILMKHEIDNLKTQNENCIRECDVKDTTIKELRDSISEFKTKCKEIGIESNDRFAKILQLQDEVKRKGKEMHDLSTETKQIQSDFREIQADLDKQAEELRILKSKMLLRVNLFCHHRSNIITKIEQALMIILKEKIEENQLELNFVQFTDNIDDNGDPTIVLCLTTSHVEHDATYAVKQLNMSTKTALLMIHHKDEHALPLVSSRCVLTSPRFKPIGCITDMAFLSGKGFLPCEINNSSIVRLVNFIRKEGVKYRKHEL